MLDRLLVETWLLARDEGTFRLLYQRHAPALWRLALRLTNGHEPTAEDIVQDAWLRAVERLPAFRWQSKLRTWLCGFVVNRWREQVRRESLDQQRIALLENDTPATTRCADPAQQLDLATAFASLPTSLREVLALHDLEGFKHREIAKILGIAPGTSKRRLFDARRALRAFFASEITR